MMLTIISGGGGGTVPGVGSTPLSGFSQRIPSANYKDNCAITSFCSDISYFDCTQRWSKHSNGYGNRCYGNATIATAIVTINDITLSTAVVLK
jgi:hypothetical protein